MLKTAEGPSGELSRVERLSVLISALLRESGRCSGVSRLVRAHVGLAMQGSAVEKKKIASRGDRTHDH